MLYALQSMKHGKRNHFFVRYKRLPWVVCHGCGLVLLNNTATRLAVMQSCAGG